MRTSSNQKIGKKERTPRLAWGSNTHGNEFLRLTGNLYEMTDVGCFITDNNF